MNLADAAEKREMDGAQADRVAAEKAILAKAASNKVKAAGDIAIDAINAKSEALQQKNQAEKAVVDACARVEQLEAPQAKATAEWIATSQAVQSDTVKEEEAVASRAIISRTFGDAEREEEGAEKAAEFAAKDAKDSQAEHEAYSKLLSEKRLGLGKAEDELNDLDVSRKGVEVQAKHNDVELVKTLANQKHARKLVKVEHAIMLKAKKDAADIVERSAAEKTIYEAAKEESHRAAAKGFHKLYEKVEAEQQLKEACTKAPTPPEAPTEEPANCTTITGTQCVFPFRYAGTSYDRCTSYSNNGVPWCSTQTDDAGNHIVGNYDSCNLDTCQQANQTDEEVPAN